GVGTVNECAVYAFSQDVTVNDGAVSVAQCAKIKKIYDLAAKTGCPVVSIFDSNGVKLSEGFEVLSAYGELVKASASLSGVCPQIAVVAGACLGTSALIANMADVIIAVKDADFYISAPSEVTAETSYKEGTVDVLCNDFDAAVETVKDLVSLLPSNNLSPAPIFDFAAPQTAVTSGADTLSIIASIADDASVVELKGGYAASNCKTALATVMGTTVGFVAFDGNALCPSCSYKAEAMIKLCDAYSIPVVTLVNANGVVAEKENQTLTALTKLTSAYASATCAKISVVTGKAIGCAYVTLAGKGANSDYTIAWDCSVASPLDADSAVAFLYNDRLAKGEDRDALKAEYIETIASPFTAAACGAVDDICAPADTRAKVISALDMLAGKRENTLPRKHSVK
ncbi:MAG: carboxyl transferase, partial [Eubacterium sp.]|nr:carboxyl transferase [Eubacterium sp.]